jgi:hypothetical protein
VHGRPVPSVQVDEPVQQSHPQDLAALGEAALRAYSARPSGVSIRTGGVSQVGQVVRETHGEIDVAVGTSQGARVDARALPVVGSDPAQ